MYMNFINTPSQKLADRELHERTGIISLSFAAVGSVAAAIGRTVPVSFLSYDRFVPHY